MTTQNIMSALVGLMGGIVIGMLFKVRILVTGEEAENLHKAQILAKNALALLDDGDVANVRYALAEIVKMGEDG